MISRCSSPIPEMIVWLVSSSSGRGRSGPPRHEAVEGRRELVVVGPLDFGSIATVDDRLGERRSSRATIGAFSAASVSPVVVSLEAHDRRRSRPPDRVVLLAVVGVHLEDAADPLVLPRDRELRTRSPALSVPE